MTLCTGPHNQLRSLYRTGGLDSCVLRFKELRAVLLATASRSNNPEKAVVSEVGGHGEREEEERMRGSGDRDT